MDAPQVAAAAAENSPTRSTLAVWAADRSSSTAGYAWDLQRKRRTMTSRLADSIGGVLDAVDDARVLAAHALIGVATEVEMPGVLELHLHEVD